MSINKLLDALSNPTRYQVYVAILEGGCPTDPGVEHAEHNTANCVGTISEKLGLPQPTVSNHVKELVNAGLLESVRKGKRVYFYGTEDAAIQLESFSNQVTNLIKSRKS